MFEIEVAPEPVKLFIGPGFYLDKRISPSQNPAYRYHQQFHQIMTDLRCLPRVAKFGEYIRQCHRVFRLHETPKKPENYTNPRTVNSPPLDIVFNKPDRKGQKEPPPVPNCRTGERSVL